MALALAAPVGAQEAVSVRDSAGVEIVENRVDLADLPTLRLAPEPRLRIGVVEGDPSYMFDRINGVTVLSDGSVAVSNWGSSEIRLFDADGRFVWTVGGHGEGPGEFQRLAGMFRRPGDTLVVYDGALQRITRIAPDGTVGAVRRLEVGAPIRSVRGIFGDGTLLVAAQRQHDVGADGFRAAELHLRYAPDGGALDSLGTYQAERFFRLRGQFYAQPLFQTSPVSAVLRNGYVAAEGTEYGFQIHAMDGTLAKTVRWEGPDPAVTDEAVALYWDERMTGLDNEQRRAVREQRDATPVAERFPALDALEVTSSGGVWVRSFRRPGVDVQEWLVFDVDGVLRARVELPPFSRYYPFAFGDSWVAGRETDEFGVEHVVVRDLVAASSNPVPAPG